MGDKEYCAEFNRLVSIGREQAEHWGHYLVIGDWLHEKIHSSAARINNYKDIPQELFDITSNVEPSSASYFDWMAGSNDVKGYCIVVLRGNFARLEMVLNLKFALADFKVSFKSDDVPYGFSNTFSDNITPKSIVDAFWRGVNEKDIRNKLDVLLNGRLDTKI